MMLRAVPLFLVLTSALLANPQGCRVVAGDASQIMSPDAATLLMQCGKRTILEWDAFSIGVGEKVQFQQFDWNSAVLNRVVGSESSALMGELLSNGKIYLINPNGVLIGPGSRIEASSFIASSLDILNDHFLNDELLFSGNSLGAVVNLGDISCSSGDVALIARKVSNQGKIEAGHAALASGIEVLLRPDGEQRIFIRSGVETNPEEGTAVENTGQIQALIVELKSGVSPYSKAISMSGQIDAKTVTREGGRVYLKATSGVTEVSGSIDGMHVEVLGTDVHLLNGARIDASGEAGGGEVLVGGDYQGNNPEIMNAKHVWVGKDTEVKADALENGNGGKVIFWADEVMSHSGKISIRGGGAGGDGGFAEVSGKMLDFHGNADGLAPLGKAGMLLLDPNDVQIQSTLPTTGTFSGCSAPPASPSQYTALPIDTTSFILNTDIETLLATCSVTIDTTGSGGSGMSGPNNGSISNVVGAPVAWSSNTTLTLTASSFIQVNDAFTNTYNTGGADIFVAMAFTAVGTNAGANDGIQINAAISSGTGTITLIGNADATTGSPGHGVNFVTPGSVQSTTGTINVSGNNANTNVSATSGVYLNSTVTGSNQISGTSCNINVSGNVTNGTTDPASAGVNVGTAWTTSTTGTVTLGSAISGGVTGCTSPLGHGFFIQNAFTASGNVVLENCTSTSSTAINITSTFTTTGSITATNNITGVLGFASLGSISSNGGGAISITATGTGASTSDAYGIQIGAGGLLTSGSIVLVGTGGPSTAAVGDGVLVHGPIQVTSASGSISITGTASGTGGNHGVNFTANGPSASATNTPITITGQTTSTGGNGFQIGSAWTTSSVGDVNFTNCTSTSGIGVNVAASFTTSKNVICTGASGGASGMVSSGAIFSSTGGNINLSATGTGSSSASHGIWLDGTSMQIHSNTGTITLNGTGADSSVASHGIYFLGASAIQTPGGAGAGAINVTGTASGSGLSHGIFLNASTSSSITGGSSPITLNGTTSSSNTTSPFPSGVFVNFAWTPSTSGAITFGTCQSTVSPVGIGLQLGAQLIIGVGGIVANGASSNISGATGCLINGGISTTGPIGITAVSSSSTDATGTPSGITLLGGTVTTSGNGGIKLIGSGSASTSATSTTGVWIEGGVVSTTTAGGPISIAGQVTSSSQTNPGVGVLIAALNGVTTTNGGAISISGTSKAQGASSHGVSITSGLNVGAASGIVTFGGSITDGTTTIAGCVGSPNIASTVAGGHGINMGSAFTCAGAFIAVQTSVANTGIKGGTGQGSCGFFEGSTFTAGGSVNITASTLGTGTGTACGIDIQGGILQTSSGNITLIGTGSGANLTGASTSYGVLLLTNGSVKNTGSGSISVAGQCLTNTTSPGVGVGLLVTSGLTSTGNGAINVSGTSAAGGASSCGVISSFTWTTGTHGTVTFGAAITDASVSGIASITGCQGGAGSTSHGMQFGGIFSTGGPVTGSSIVGGIGSGSDGFISTVNFTAGTAVAGAINLSASTGSASGTSYGINISGGTFTTNNGSITLNGTGSGANGTTTTGVGITGGIVTTTTGSIGVTGTVPSSTAIGVGVALAATGINISTSGTNSITVTGTTTASGVGSHGVALTSSSQISTGTGSGNIIISGTSNSTAAVINHGLFLDSGSTSQITGTGACNIYVNGTTLSTNPNAHGVNIATPWTALNVGTVGTPVTVNFGNDNAGGGACSASAGNGLNVIVPFACTGANCNVNMQNCTSTSGKAISIAAQSGNTTTNFFTTTGSITATTNIQGGGGGFSLSNAAISPHSIIFGSTGSGNIQVTGSTSGSTTVSGIHGIILASSSTGTVAIQTAGSGTITLVGVNNNVNATTSHGVFLSTLSQVTTGSGAGVIAISGNTKSTSSSTSCNGLYLDSTTVNQVTGAGEIRLSGSTSCGSSGSGGVFIGTTWTGGTTGLTTFGYDLSGITGGVNGCNATTGSGFSTSAAFTGTGNVVFENCTATIGKGMNLGSSFVTSGSITAIVGISGAGGGFSTGSNFQSSGGGAISITATGTGSLPASHGIVLVGTTVLSTTGAITLIGSYDPAASSSTSSAGFQMQGTSQISGNGGAGPINIAGRVFNTHVTPTGSCFGVNLTSSTVAQITGAGVVCPITVSGTSVATGSTSTGVSVSTAWTTNNSTGLVTFGGSVSDGTITIVGCHGGGGNASNGVAIVNALTASGPVTAGALTGSATVVGGIGTNSDGFHISSGGSIAAGGDVTIIASTNSVGAGTAFGVVLLQGGASAITTTGSHSISLTGTPSSGTTGSGVSAGISVSQNSTISTDSGNISLTALALSSAPVTPLVGINVFSGGIIQTTGGTITFNGASNGTAGNSHGVNLQGPLTTGTNGLVTFSGVGGTGGNGVNLGGLFTTSGDLTFSNCTGGIGGGGVSMAGAVVGGSLNAVTAISGGTSGANTFGFLSSGSIAATNNILITASAGGGTTGTGTTYGIVFDGGLIGTPNTISAAGGTMTLIGQGSTASTVSSTTGVAVGISTPDYVTLSTTSSGTTTITGTVGNGSPSGVGVSFATAATPTTGANGAFTVSGTSGTTGSYGVSIASWTTGTTGTVSISGSSANSDGINVSGAFATGGAAYASGSTSATTGTPNGISFTSGSFGTTGSLLSLYGAGSTNATTSTCGVNLSGTWAISNGTTGGSLNIGGLVLNSTGTGVGILMGGTSGTITSSSPMNFSGTSLAAGAGSYGVSLAGPITVTSSQTVNFGTNIVDPISTNNVVGCVGGTSSDGLNVSQTFTTGGSISAITSIRGGAGAASNGFTSTSNYTAAGNIAITASTSGTTGTPIGISISSGTFESTGGTITLIGTGSTSNAVAQTYGVNISGSAIVESGAGDLITLTGIAPASSAQGIGVLLSSTAFPATGTASPIAISGTSATTATNSYGVLVSDWNAPGTTGSVTFSNSQGGSGANSDAISFGIAFTNTGNITAINSIVGGTGTGSNGITIANSLESVSGDISLTASTAATGGTPYGIDVTGGTISGGAITLIGTGSSSNSVTSTAGFNFASPAAIAGTGVVSLAGRVLGGSSSSVGVLLSTANITGSAIDISGTTATGSYGVEVNTPWSTTGIPINFGSSITDGVVTVSSCQGVTRGLYLPDSFATGGGSFTANTSASGGTGSFGFYSAAPITTTGGLVSISSSNSSIYVGDTITSGGGNITLQPSTQVNSSSLGNIPQGIIQFATTGTTLDALTGSISLGPNARSAAPAIATIFGNDLTFIGADFTMGPNESMTSFGDISILANTVTVSDIVAFGNLTITSVNPVTITQRSEVILLSSTGTQYISPSMHLLGSAVPTVTPSYTPTDAHVGETFVNSVDTLQYIPSNFVLNYDTNQMPIPKPALAQSLKSQIVFQFAVANSQMFYLLPMYSKYTEWKYIPYFCSELDKECPKEIPFYVKSFLLENQLVE